MRRRVLDSTTTSRVWGTRPAGALIGYLEVLIGCYRDAMTTSPIWGTRLPAGDKEEETETETERQIVRERGRDKERQRET